MNDSTEKSTTSGPVPEQAVRAQLEAILTSPVFAASDRLRRFLQYTVNSVFDGTSERLKESWIATAVYNRGENFDPSQASIVRTEARRLRNKLKEYYDTLGQEDPVVIQFRLGSYVPSFRSRALPVPDEPVAPVRVASSVETMATGTSIAVMPFVDVSGQALADQCAKNLTRELIHGFMHTEGVRVAALGSVPPTDDISVLAKRLGVQVVFQGTVSQESNRLRVIISLANTEGFQVWSQRFEANADAQGLFVLTEQLASSLISRTRPEHSDTRKRNAPTSEQVITLLPSLYGAETLLDTGSAVELQSALAKFQRVADCVPDHARVYAGLAQCHYLTAMRGSASPAKSVAMARKAAAQAVELDPGMITAQTALGCVRGLEWQWDQAEICFQTALELGEHPTAHRHYALFLTSMGRFDEASYHLQKAHSIDPFAVAQKIATTLFLSLSNRFEEASHYATEQLAFGGLPVRARLYMALALFHAGKRDEAVSLTSGSRVEASSEPPLVAMVAEILARCGEVDQAARVVRQSRLLAPNAAISNYRQTLLSLALEQTDEAWSHLEKAYNDREPELLWLGVEPRFDALRSEERFAELQKKILPLSEF